MNLRFKILYELATKNIVPSQALFALAPSRTSVWHILTRLERAGYVRKVKYSMSRKGRRRMTVTYYTITRSGTEHFRDKGYRFVPWAGYIDPSRSPARIIADDAHRRDIVRTFFRSSIAGVMADIIGAQESTVYCAGVSDMSDNTLSEECAYEELGGEADETDSLEEDDCYSQDSRYRRIEAEIRENEPCGAASASERYPSLASVITAAKRMYETDLGQRTYGPEVLASRPALMFMDALTMKRKAETYGKGSARTYDLRAARCAGMFRCLHIKSVLVYVSTAASILDWNSDSWPKEKKLFSDICTGVYNEKAPTAAETILLVPDPLIFARTYFSRELTERGETGRKTAAGLMNFGEGTEAMYVAPYTYEGAKELKLLVTTDLEAEHEKVTELLIGTQEFERNSRLSPTLFPLRDDFDTLISIGIHIDVQQIRHIQAIAGRYPAYSYGILCREWQVPYYEAVTRNIDIHPIDDLLAGTDIPDPEGQELKMAIETEGETVRRNHPSGW